MSGAPRLALLWSSFLLRVCFDAPELPAPVLREHPAPVVNRAKCRCIRSVQDSLAVPSDGDEADLPKHLQVLRRRRLLHLEGVGDIADRSLLCGNELENVTTARLRNGIERI